jgi:glycosyltransferase involved in cell wall biosynthesis
MKTLTPPTQPLSPLEASITSHPQVEVVIPVFNEERLLRSSVTRVRRHMLEQLDLDFQITIVDNASVDRTASIAAALAREYPEVNFMRLEQKGRGRALRAAWSASRTEVVAYMDVDLSTDLCALEDLLRPLLDGRADISIGSRLAPGASVARGLKRETISRSYNLLLRVLLDAGFSDAQCGFKAARREPLLGLLDQVQDERWFFDTELLHRAERAGLTICEVPVRWVDDPDSRVDILATAREDLKGILRLRQSMRRLPSCQIASRHISTANASSTPR